jgi:hypothetical protein
MENGVGAVCNSCGSLVWKNNNKCQCGKLAFLSTPKIKNGLIFTDTPTDINIVKVYYQNEMLVRFTRMPTLTVGKPVYMQKDIFKSIFKEVKDELFFTSEEME